MVYKVYRSVQIWASSPPLEDVPTGLPELVNSLIRDGWTFSRSDRPDAAKLLQHEAFHLLGSYF